MAPKGVDGSTDSSGESLIADVVLTRPMLDGMGCSNPECGAHDGPMTIHSRCHPEVPMWVTYENGILNVECAQCGGLVCRLLME